MEELEALRKMVEQHDYTAALALIDEMDEMAKDDKIVKIESFLHVLLVHLIKQHAEKKTTNSWNRSINFSLRGISKSNKRRSSGGFYLKPQELEDAIEEIFNDSLQDASEEAFGGAYDKKVLVGMIDIDIIKKEALMLILNYQD
ncbi:MAG: DUF29 family protein [Arcicella sp.]|nr:DUF29 family protein [Arcicella sp.]